VIRLGYEIGTGAAVDIPLDHTAVTGRTQQSGKTTTLEALVHRSKLRAVVFVTKKAEAGFRDANPIPPHFADSADWQFVSSILEAMLSERVKFERSWIIDACKGADGLADVQENIRRKLHGVRALEDVTRPYGKRKKVKREWDVKPATGLSQGILTNLNAYLDIVIPQLMKLPYTATLELKPGLNVMDLSGYSSELQSLVIRSVLKWVYERERNTIVIIPEAWEFIPQNRRSPVLLAAEELIRKGAAAGNFVWLDSQDIAGVHKNVLRSVGVWILGVQREANEVKRTLNHIPRPAPSATDLMMLGRGQFFACFKDKLHKVYVQPFWVGDVHARSIARGEEPVESAERIWKESRHAQRQSVPNPSDFRAPHQLLQIQEQTPDGPDSDKPELEKSGSAGDGGGIPAAAIEPSVRLDDHDLRADECARSENPQHAAPGDESEDGMWREKYENLKNELDGFRNVVREAIKTGDFEYLKTYHLSPPANGHAAREALVVGEDVITDEIFLDLCREAAKGTQWQTKK